MAANVNIEAVNRTVNAVFSNTSNDDMAIYTDNTAQKIHLGCGGTGAGSTTSTVQVTGSNVSVNGDMICSGNLSAGNLGMFRNRIINGDMRINQRGTVNVSAGSGSKYYSIDRFFAFLYHPSNGLAVFSQSSIASNTAPYQKGFKNSFLLTASIGFAGNYNCNPMQAIEGYNISDFNWGTSSATNITVSFWFRTNAASGSTFNLTIQNESQDISYNTALTFQTSGVYQYYTVTIPPPPVGSIWYTDNNIGMLVGIGGYQSSVSMAPTTNVWHPNNYGSSTGVTNILGTTNNYIEFTGVQVEKGSVATPFEFRPYTIEMQLCQRYYFISQKITLMKLSSTNPNYAGIQPQSLSFPVDMRFAPGTGNMILLNVTGNGNISNSSHLLCQSSTRGVQLHHATSFSQEQYNTFQLAINTEL